MTTINLDQKRDERAAARAEAQEEPVVVVVGGHSITLPAEWPYEAVTALAAGEPMRALEVLFGDEFHRLRDANLTVADVEVLLTGLTKAAGFTDPGE